MNAPTRKTASATTLLQAVSVNGIATALAENSGNGVQNVVQFPDKYEAEALGNAFARHELGESGRGKGKASGFFVSKKTAGLAFHPHGPLANILLTIRDVTSKATDGSADWRSMILGSVLGGLKVKRIAVSDNFGPLIIVSLEGLPLYPPCPNDEALATILMDLQAQGLAIQAIGKKIDYVKKIVRKAGDKATAADGSTSTYYPPSGTTETIVYADTEERIPTERREVHRVRLATNQTAPDLAALFPEWTEMVPAAYVKSGKNEGNLKKGTGIVALRSDTELLPLYMAEQTKRKAAYEALYATVRPFELGVIERAQDAEGGAFPEHVELDGTIFEIEITLDTEYDQPTETAHMLAKGIWEKRSVPKTRGNWRVVAAPVKAETSMAVPTT